MPVKPMEGTTVAASVEFRNPGGSLFDPIEVTMMARRPDTGEWLDLAPIRLGLGTYESQFVVIASGRWLVRAIGSGSTSVVEELRFEVRESHGD